VVAAELVRGSEGLKEWESGVCGGMDVDGGVARAGEDGGGRYGEGVDVCVVRWEC
jgi:hypothetical protein